MTSIEYMAKVIVVRDSRIPLDLEDIRQWFGGWFRTWTYPVHLPDAQRSPFLLLCRFLVDIIPMPPEGEVMLDGIDQKIEQLYGHFIKLFPKTPIYDSPIISSSSPTSSNSLTAPFMPSDV